MGRKWRKDNGRYILLSRLADGLVSIDTGFVAIAVDGMVAGLVQGRLLLNSESEVPRAWPLLKLISFSLTMR